MSREHFLAYYRTIAVAERDPVACLRAFGELLEFGTDVEISNALLFLQLKALDQLNRKLRDIYGEDIEIEESFE